LFSTPTFTLDAAPLKTVNQILKSKPTPRWLRASKCFGFGSGKYFSKWGARKGHQLLRNAITKTL